MYSRWRELREDHDLTQKTQKQLAAFLQMSQTGYSKYETGENDVPTHILLNLAAFYQTSVDYLLGHTDQRKAYPPAQSKGE